LSEQHRPTRAPAERAEIATAYRNFRLAKGAINYDDQIALAGALLRHPEAARRIREKNYRVILDEAQDTDPTQFDLLLRNCAPARGHRCLARNEECAATPGHFCMVGDFQQSDFGDAPILRTTAVSTICCCAPARAKRRSSFP